MIATDRFQTPARIFGCCGMHCRRGCVSMTYLLAYVTMTYPTTRSSFQLVVARGESLPRFIFQGFTMPSAAEKTLPLP